MKLQDKYKKEVIPAMMQRFGFKSPMAVPRIEKVVVNIGFGRLVAGKTGEEQKKIYEAVSNDLAQVTGQKPELKKAKKSISSFKVRQGMPLGASVTLRKKKMYDFLEKFINVTLPRTRDFQGVDSKAVDKQGNITVGVKEHIIFPEISPENVRNIFGLEITVATTAKSKEKGLEFFKMMGFPMRAQS